MVVPAILALAALNGEASLAAPEQQSPSRGVGSAPMQNIPQTVESQIKFAVVGSDGITVRGRGVTSSQRFNTGNYEVIFNRNVTACAYVLTEGSTGSSSVTPLPGYGTVVGRKGNANGVYITTFNSDGVLANRAFHLVVVC